MANKNNNNKRKLESITYEDVNAAKARIKENQEKLDQLIKENSYHDKNRKKVVPYWLTSKWNVPKELQEFKIQDTYSADNNIVWEMVKKRDGTPIKYGPYELTFAINKAFVKFPDGTINVLFNNERTSIYNGSGSNDHKFFSLFKDFIIEVSKDREAVLNKRKSLMAKISVDNNIIKAHQEGVENYQEYLEKKKEKRQEKIEKKLAKRSKEEVERLTKLALLISKFKPVMDEIEEGIGDSEYVFNFGNFTHRMRHIEDGLKHLEYLTSSVKNKK